MKNKKKNQIETISVEQIENEIARIEYKKKFNQIMRSTFFVLIVVASIAVLIATMFLPVLNVYGVSMTPTFNDGDIVVCVKTSNFELGDEIAFYYNNKILVKRVIANSAQWIDIDQEGNVFIDKTLLDEPYVQDKAFGDCNITLPYQIPDGRYFVMGDYRSTSADSRIEEIGCVSQEQVVGKIVFRVWPLSSFGLV